MGKIKSSLKWKLISLLIAIIVSMVAMIGFFSYYDTSRTIRQDVVHFSEQILKQANLNLDRQYMEYERGFLVLGTSHEFLQWLQIPSEDRYEIISGYHSLENNYMRSFLVRHPEILSISLVSDLGSSFNYSLSGGVSKDYELRNEPWIGEVARLEKVYKRVGVSTAYVDSNGASKNIMLFSMAGQFGQHNKGILKMDISLESAQNILNEMKLGEEGEGLIAKPDGTILVHQNSEMVGRVLEPDIIKQIGAPSGSYFRKDTNQLIIFDTIPYTGWKTVAIISNKEVASSINRVRNVTIAAASFGMIMAIILVTLVATSITRRLSKLRSHMKKAQTGNFAGRIDESGTDEVADLSRSFNRMLEELDSSIRQLTETRLMQQRAAFSAMQSQIHSHFLYNSLESINSMAHLAGHKEIERTSISLSRMLRYTSNYRDTLVRLEDEIKHVIHYLNICKIRFGEHVSFDIDFPEECQEVQCLKVVLQPIVENAIKHGIETTGEPTQIDVTVRREGEMICVIIADNGQEHDEDRLEAFREKLLHADVTAEEYTSFTNVGLLNVHYRLKAFYHRDGVGVEIGKGGRLGGVEVRLHFPCSYNAEKELLHL